jgi:hypothetical protein
MPRYCRVKEAQVVDGETLLSDVVSQPAAAHETGQGLRHVWEEGAAYAIDFAEASGAAGRGGDPSCPHTDALDELERARGSQSARRERTGPRDNGQAKEGSVARRAKLKLK